MEGLASKYSDDHEAQIFYGVALALRKSDRLKPTPLGSRQAAILESYSRKNRTIPAGALHHHTTTCRLWRKGAYRRTGVIPISRLMRHTRCICRHTTFTRVGYWQIPSTATVPPPAASRRVGQTAEELHASDYRLRLLQTAQDEAARKVLEALAGDGLAFESRVV